MRRLGLTVAELRRVLETLAGFGFAAHRLEFAPNGVVIIQAESTQDATGDPLAEWEARRASSPH